MKLSFLNDQIPEINSNRNNLQKRIYRHGSNHDKRYEILFNKIKLKLAISIQPTKTLGRVT